LIAVRIRNYDGHCGRVVLDPVRFTSRKLRNERMGAESTLVDGGVPSKFPVETSIGGRVRIRAGRGRGQIIPASPCVGAGLLPPLALRTLPPVRQLNSSPRRRASATITTTSSDRVFAAGQSMSTRARSGSSSSVRTRARREQSAPPVAHHHRALVGEATTTLDDSGVVHELAAKGPGSGADVSADR
jgi:hypothetical protein